MSEKQFKFVSPGIQIQEIDNPVSPGEDQIGPAIIGRAQRGPAMRPVKVSSFSEFIDIFGNPTPTSEQADVWRDNAILGPTYGVLAAQASLKNNNSLTFVRLLGTEHAEANATTGVGKAGFKIGSTTYTGPGGGGGAYGLFIFPSQSAAVVTGTLAAVFYLTTGSVVLSGTRYGNNSSLTEGTGTAGMFMSNDSKQFRVFVKNGSDTIVDDLRFDFTPSSDKFIRKVCNTNPTRLNSSLFSTTKTYFVGESFEDFINESDEMVALRSATTWVGVILGLKNTSTSDDLCNRQLASQNSKTGWFFAQDFNNYQTYQYDNMQKLFRFHSLDSGEWNQANIKISIRNIRVSPNDYDRFGSFDVLVRSIDDSDSALVIYEQFTNCNLNPRSDNYLAKKIGDKYITYSTSLERNLEIGQFDNRSKFIRVEMAPEVESEASSPECLPFGVYGPVKFKNFAFSSGSLTSLWGNFYNVQTAYTSPFVAASSYIAQADSTGTIAVGMGIAAQGIIKTASVIFPQPRLRLSTTSGTLSSPKSAFFGVYTDDTNQKFSKGVKDLVRVMPQGVDSFTPDSAEGTDYSFVFSLDDVKYEASSATDVRWSSGSRLEGTSLTALTGTYSSILSQGFNAFTTFLAGGFDGLDIREIEPFNNTDMSSVTAKTSYAYNSVQRAIEMLRDPEETEFNIAAIPGITVPGLTGRLIEVCEERGDALAIIDIENDFQPRSENLNSVEIRKAAISVNNAITSLRTRGLNSNYGAAYFPWVQAREPFSNNIIFIPPTVPVLGVLAYNDKVAARWFVPAGFQRGSLSAGHGGIPVIGVTRKLNKKDRDDLYLANINPISVLDNEIVILGQKTLQIRPSALDRVNVRRALLDIKKKISKIAATMLFEPNVETTWNKFKTKAEPVLRDIVARSGLEAYKLKLDSTTTTPDLQDRNIVYGKLFLKPVKAVEFIGFDFNITNSGASFTDL